MIEHTTYIIVKNGIVQFLKNDFRDMMPVFTHHKDAIKFCRRYPGSTVAQVGSLDGETLEDHLEANFAAGRAALLVDKLLANGKLVGRELHRSH